MRTRQPHRYEVDVQRLASYAELHAFQGAASFYAWERLNTLVARLLSLFDVYELEGDALSVRREVENYQQDLARFGLQPDEWVAAHLGAFLAWLDEEVSLLEITVGSEPQSRIPRWPHGYLAVRAEDLAAHMRQRSEQV